MIPMVAELELDIRLLSDVEYVHRSSEGSGQPRTVRDETKGST